MVITRNTALLSAVVAAALVAGLEIGASRAESSSAAVQVAQRFPLTSEMFTPTPIGSFVAKKLTAEQKAAAQRAVAAHKALGAQGAQGSASSQFCAVTPRGWPYVSHECRVAAAGMSFTLS